MADRDRPDVIIRPMAERDRPIVLDLIVQLNRFEDAISGDRATRRADALACLNATSARIAAADGGAVLVAEFAGRVIGYAALVFEEAGAFVRADLRRNGFILELVVDEHMRGQGIGRALIAECERRTRAAGRPVLGIGVLAGNASARVTYENAGFRVHALEMLKRLDSGTEASSQTTEDEA